jgi:glycosyltransferase involved in cell wall biosynthesis
MIYMKILLVNKFNYQRTSGADKYFLDLAELLAAQGHEVAKFSMKHDRNLSDKYDKYFVDNIDFNRPKITDIFKYISRVIYSIEARKKFAQVIMEFKPDIIHIHNIYHQISPSILPVAKKFNIPVVAHLHDYKMLCPNYKMYNRKGICEKCRGGKYYNCLLNKCLKNSYPKSLLASIEMYLHHRFMKIYEKNIDLYISSSDFMKEKAIEWGLPKNKIFVLPYFIEIEKYHPKFDKGDYLLYFGRLSEEKGIGTLIKAMESVNKEMTLKIVGTGPEYSNLEKLVKSLHLDNRVEFVGSKFNNDLRKIISNSFLVVVPSQWYEVFGIVIIEAQAMGKPVLASRIGGITEIIEDNKNSFLFSPGNHIELAKKINNIINNNDLEAIAKNANFSVKKYNSMIHIKNLTKIYLKLNKNNKLKINQYSIDK